MDPRAVLSAWAKGRQEEDERAVRVGHDSGPARPSRAGAPHLQGSPTVSTPRIKVTSHPTGSCRRSVGLRAAPITQMG